MFWIYVLGWKASLKRARAYKGRHRKLAFDIRGVF